MCVDRRRSAVSRGKACVRGSSSTACGGPAPGKPWGMQCSLRGDDFLCAVSSSNAMQPVEMGFRGPGSTLCFRMRGQPTWIPISLQTVGIVFALLPENLRRDAVHKTQAQYRFTGQNPVRPRPRLPRRRDPRGRRLRRDGLLLRPRVFRGRPEGGADPAADGFEPGFITTLAENGIGWRIVEHDKAGAPKLAGEATRIEARAVDPAIFAGVCGMP